MNYSHCNPQDCNRIPWLRRCRLVCERIFSNPNGVPAYLRPSVLRFLGYESLRWGNLSFRNRLDCLCRSQKLLNPYHWQARSGCRRGGALRRHSDLRGLCGTRQKTPLVSLLHHQYVRRRFSRRTFARRSFHGFSETHLAILLLDQSS